MRFLSNIITFTLNFLKPLLRSKRVCFMCQHGPWLMLQPQIQGKCKALNFEGPKGRVPLLGIPPLPGSALSNLHFNNSVNTGHHAMKFKWDWQKPHGFIQSLNCILEYGLIISSRFKTLSHPKPFLKVLI